MVKNCCPLVSIYFIPPFNPTLKLNYVFNSNKISLL